MKHINVNNLLWHGGYIENKTLNILINNIVFLVP